MTDIANPFFDIEAHRVAIRALRNRIFDVCRGEPGDITIQALMEALVSAIESTMPEADHATAGRTIADLIAQALDPPEAR